MLVFDIETGPLPDEDLRQLLPKFQPKPTPGEFDASQVKVGNLKDPAKVNEKIEAAREAHQRAVQNYVIDCEIDEREHFNSFKESAALDATTGTVLAIGYHNGQKAAVDRVDESFERDEVLVVENFWKYATRARNENQRLVGHNIIGFDVPFLIRRSWLLGIEVPDWALPKQNRFFPDLFVDTLVIWKLGQYQIQPGSGTLDRVGKAFRLGGKVDGIDGADFARLFFGTAEERAAALEYLRRDVELTYRVASRLGIA